MARHDHQRTRVGTGGRSSQCTGFRAALTLSPESWVVKRVPRPAPTLLFISKALFNGGHDGRIGFSASVLPGAPQTMRSYSDWESSTRINLVQLYVIGTDELPPVFHWYHN